jgi:hypothetical protein
MGHSAGLDPRRGQRCTAGTGCHATFFEASDARGIEVVLLWDANLSSATLAIRRAEAGLPHARDL